MYVNFWGTRGSLPASATTRQIREKIFQAIRASRSHDLATDEKIGAFIDRELPFAVRGSYGETPPVSKSAAVRDSSSATREPASGISDTPLCVPKRADRRPSSICFYRIYTGTISRVFRSSSRPFSPIRRSISMAAMRLWRRLS